MTHPIKAFREANELTLEAFAKAVGVQKAAVWKWESGVAPSAEAAIKIEAATDRVVTRSMLRPDLWPAEALAS